MYKCIFCNSIIGPFNTQEHILPESLGGEVLLPKGFICDSCQNFFGSSIEKISLNDFPFRDFRVFLGIPTKKGKAPWFKYDTPWYKKHGKYGEILIAGCPFPGKIEIIATPDVLTFDKGNEFSLILSYFPIEAPIICRFLVKMGIEIIALKNYEEVLNDKYNDAKIFARFGKTTKNWWYVLNINNEDKQNFIKNGVTYKEWLNNCNLAVFISQGIMLFRLKLLYMMLITPLVPCSIAMSPYLKEPEWFLYEI